LKKSPAVREFLVRERIMDLGGVEERDALLAPPSDQGNHLLPVTRQAAMKARV